MITYEQLDNLILVSVPFVEHDIVDDVTVHAQSMKLVVGSHVKLRKVELRHDGYGMIVAIVDAETCVLWSIEPIHSVDPLKNFAFPVVRQHANYLVAQQLVSIQPMSLPSGLVFLMDYTYGSGSLGTSSLGET